MIFNLFGSKNDDDDDDETSEISGYTSIHYRDHPFYQELLGITPEQREREKQQELESENDDEPKKGWFGLW